MFKNKKFFLILISLLILGGCKDFFDNPYDPTNPEPEEYADFLVEYVRGGPIVNPEIISPYKVCRFITTYSNGEQTMENKIKLEKKGERFIGELNHVALHKRFNDRVFDFYVPDSQRQPNNTFPMRVFGDIIFLTNKQTGIRYQLVNVIDYELGKHYVYSYASGSTMARCRILHDSSIPESAID